MRIKRGKTKHQRHKKVLEQTKGFRMSYNRLYRRAKEALLHSGQYSMAHRRRRRSQMREQWIQIIAAGLHTSGMSYSKFMGRLKQKEIILDKKILAEIAQSNPDHFQQLVQLAASEQ